MYLVTHDKDSFQKNFKLYNADKNYYAKVSALKDLKNHQVRFHYPLVPFIKLLYSVRLKLESTLDSYRHTNECAYKRTERDRRRQRH